MSSKDRKRKYPFGKSSEESSEDSIEICQIITGDLKRKYPFGVSSEESSEDSIEIYQIIARDNERESSSEESEGETTTDKPSFSCSIQILTTDRKRKYSVGERSRRRYRASCNFNGQPIYREDMSESGEESVPQPSTSQNQDDTCVTGKRKVDAAFPRSYKRGKEKVTKTSSSGYRIVVTEVEDEDDEDEGGYRNDIFVSDDEFKRFMELISPRASSPEIFYSDEGEFDRLLDRLEIDGKPRVRMMDRESAESDSEVIPAASASSSADGPDVASAAASASTSADAPDVASAAASASTSADAPDVASAAAASAAGASDSAAASGGNSAALGTGGEPFVGARSADE